MMGDDDVVVMANGSQVSMRDFLRARGCNFTGVVRVAHHEWHDLGRESARWVERQKRPALTESQQKCLDGDA
jgi:hypothetical protein